MRLIVGEEKVIVRGIRPEEQLWGAYQFPRPYNLDGRLVVGVHVVNDDIKSFGEKNRWFESVDEGESWREIDDAVTAEFGLRLPDGDRIYFPMESGVSLREYRMTPQSLHTPGYDFSRRAEPGTLPLPDGMTYWMDGTVIRAYNADRLPEPLCRKEWRMMRIRAGETEPVEERAQVDWPYLTRVVFSGANYDHILKPIFPRGTPKLGPDGAVWISAFSGEGHIDPATGLYSPYYSAELFRSEDGGCSFQRRGHMEYPADGSPEYPYQSGGFSDSDFEFMPDGSIVWFFRSTWYAYTGREWDPMYMSRSTDGGFTWTKPVKFAPVGILPRLVRLECGATLLCYARPGMFIQMCEEESGTVWSDPVELMTPGDRSGLANVKIDVPVFHEWDGACNNPEMVALDERSVLFFYSDFYYPDEEGVRRKTILCRKITVAD